MNKQNISKIKLFLMGLQNRFEENSSLFDSINVTYKSGLKEFNGTGKFDNNSIKFNFNGKTQSFNISSLFDFITLESKKYDEVFILYRERGTDILISADNNNVKMTNTEVKVNPGSTKINDKKEPLINNMSQTSTLLNRNYYIKVGKADVLLKEIGIMSKDGKIKNDKIRKYNQIDHYVELLDGVLETLPRNQVINILDCGCGKSYLSFVLNYYLTEVKRRKCHFIGLDISESVIESSKLMAKNLGYRNMEFHAIDIKRYKPDKNINVVISLHACNTATDMAIALGIKLESDCIIAVPCCHKEMLSQYSYEPFNGILKHGILKARMADILTEGMRSMMLEAKGYNVSVIEYISPLETPKNLMIKAIKTSDENEDIFYEYMNLMGSLNVYPALYDFLNEDWSS
ncbi:Methyltransferase domain-containing protein [Clostridium cavendishii DSM 21758]|uniref:Methyltransferase domain-containing protein n=1 Tax=Clostridium cavendishii DSM 21758 TaxID=1121302 RepID=A0A1M6SZL8_9CLOT|nr:SAM-dependent methyltransferase [Clostridium cavendishii]SHK50127.1 Methyltransferase domain-containing protein [Clostridium cavendishii DSM 21758]